MSNFLKRIEESIMSWHDHNHNVANNYEYLFFARDKDTHKPVAYTMSCFDPNEFIAALLYENYTDVVDKEPRYEDLKELWSKIYKFVDCEIDILYGVKK